MVPDSSPLGNASSGEVREPKRMLLPSRASTCTIEKIIYRHDKLMIYKKDSRSKYFFDFNYI